MFAIYLFAKSESFSAYTSSIHNMLFVSVIIFIIFIRKSFYYLSIQYHSEDYINLAWCSVLKNITILWNSNKNC